MQRGNSALSEPFLLRAIKFDIQEVYNGNLPFSSYYCIMQTDY